MLRRSPGREPQRGAHQRQPVVAEVQVVAVDEHRRRAEAAALDQFVGVAAQALLDLGLGDPDAMAERLQAYQAQGFNQFQMKVGAGADLDIERIRKVTAVLESGNKLAADANCGWMQHEAVRVVSAVNDMPLYIEQPCETYEACRVVRDVSNHPMILDECMTSLQTVLTAHQDRAMDAVNLKISRFGGLTKTKVVRDVCAELGIIMTIEDTWGGELTDAAIAHLAHSTPRELHFQSSAFSEYATVSIASGGPVIADGFMTASEAPGLGITPNWDVLGQPIAEAS